MRADHESFVGLSHQIKPLSESEFLKKHSADNFQLSASGENNLICETFLDSSRLQLGTNFVRAPILFIC